MKNQQNNKIVIEKIYNENYDRMARFCYLRLGNRHDTEDIVSEAFLRAYKSLEKGDQIDNYTAWLYTVSRNLILDKFNSYTNKNVMTGIDYEQHEENALIDENIARDEEYKQVKNLLETLPVDQKEALFFKFYQEMDYEEISKIMEKSVNAIRLLVSKGLKNLRLEAENKKIKILPILFISPFTPQFQSSLWNSLSLNINNLHLNLASTAMNNISNATITAAKATGIVTAKTIIIGAVTAAIAVASVVTGIVLANNQNTTKTNNTVANSNTSSTSTVSVSQTSIATTSTTVVTSTIDPYLGWQSITNPDFGISIKIPSQLKYDNKILSVKLVNKVENVSCSSIAPIAFKDKNYCSNSSKSIKVTQTYIEYLGAISPVTKQNIQNLIIGAMTVRGFSAPENELVTIESEPITILNETYKYTAMLDKVTKQGYYSGFDKQIPVKNNSIWANAGFMADELLRLDPNGLSKDYKTFSSLAKQIFAGVEYVN